MRTILIVDDELAIRETLASVLEDEGYRCLEAQDGKEGLAMLKQERPDLVISDVMMPGLDGRAPVAAMRADPELRDIPVIVISAARGLPDIERIDHDAFLPKPFDIEALLEAMARLAGGRPGR